MPQNIIRVADLVEALKEYPQDARVGLLVYVNGDAFEGCIDDIFHYYGIGASKVILVGDC